ncbi:MAG: zinc ribbon domain-containing protein [Chloroflexi bacterium]|nr:zinc ribbon domain-containing protein [Chloroflexota bacterium]
MITRCPRCGQPNAPQHVVCAHCGAAMPAQSTDARAQWRTLWTMARQAWEQGIQEIRALVREWILRRPTVEGPIVAGPFAGQVMLLRVSPLRMGAAPTPQQEPALICQVADEPAMRSFQLVLVGTRTGPEPRYGDHVCAWGVWDPASPALRAWRVAVTMRNGRPVDMMCRTRRPFPTAALALGLLVLALAACLFSVISPAVRF